MELTPNMIETQFGVYKSLGNPVGATKEISGGKLKGFNEVNPQWRLEMMTKTFGLCGVGWKFDIVETNTVNCPDGQVLLYMKVAVYINVHGEWSEPIYGFGGEYIVVKFQKSGLTPNDEAYKMCLTDALGNALKCLGVAGDVYRGIYDGKYSRYSESSQGTATTQSVKVAQQTAKPQPPKYCDVTNPSEPKVATKNGWKTLTELTNEQLSVLRKAEEYKEVWAKIDELLQKQTKAEEPKKTNEEIPF